jgi:ankyrin repeat protein
MALAAYSGRIEAMQFLLERGASPDGKVGGLTGIHLAAILDRVGAVRWLVEHGADLSVTDDLHGSTPLGWAEHNRKGSAVHEYLASVASSP